MVAHFTMRTHGVNQAFRFVEGIRLHRKSHQIRFFFLSSYVRNVNNEQPYNCHEYFWTSYKDWDICFMGIYWFTRKAKVGSANTKLRYWVTQKLPQIYTASHATFPIQTRKITLQIRGNFWVTQYLLACQYSLICIMYEYIQCVGVLGHTVMIFT